MVSLAIVRPTCSVGITIMKMQFASSERGVRPRDPVLWHKLDQAHHPALAGGAKPQTGGVKKEDLIGLRSSRARPGCMPILEAPSTLLLLAGIRAQTAVGNAPPIDRRGKGVMWVMAVRIEPVTSSVSGRPTVSGRDKTVDTTILDIMQLAWENGGLRADEARTLLVGAAAKRAISGVFIGQGLPGDLPHRRRRQRHQHRDRVRSPRGDAGAGTARGQGCRRVPRAVQARRHRASTRASNFER